MMPPGLLPYTTVHVMIRSCKPCVPKDLPVAPFWPQNAVINAQQLRFKESA